MRGHTRYVFIHSNVLTYIYVDIIGRYSVPLTAATPIRISVGDANPFNYSYDGAVTCVPVVSRPWLRSLAPRVAGWPSSLRFPPVRRDRWRTYLRPCISPM
jgi:hypothetical protein